MQITEHAFKRNVRYIRPYITIDNDDRANLIETFLFVYGSYTANYRSFLNVRARRCLPRKSERLINAPIKGSMEITVESENRPARLERSEGQEGYVDRRWKIGTARIVTG